MAIVTTTTSFDNVDVEISDWVDPEVTPSFHNNANFVAPSGTVYEDYAESFWPSENYRTVWAGSALTWNATTHSLTGGTISGVFGQNLVGGNWVTEMAIEGFSIAATTVSAALNSAGTADDMAVVRSIFAGADTFNLSNENDTVDGYAGNDTLNGNGGNDLLQGGTGNDRVDGGSGTDWAVYRDAGAAVRVVLGTTAAQNTVGAGTDTLINIEGVMGSAFADTLSGASGNGIFELFSGGAGNDTINGGVISDTVNYTDGNQVEYWQTAAAGVNVNLKTGKASDGQGGTDTLINIDFVIGTGFNDTLTGSDGTLFEAFTGLGGADRFNGGDLSQGSARINYNVSPAAVNVDLAAGTAQDGYGTVDTFSNINFVRGSNFNDTLRGSNATAYAESFEGRAGNDLIDGRGGTDQARYDNAAGGVVVSLVTGRSSGGDGNDTLLGIENLRGSAFNDTLTGNAGDNALDGRTGNDSLTGGEGDDTFSGGAGNDSLVGGTQLTFDYVNYTGAGSAVTVNLGTGTASSSTEGTDTLNGIEGVLGSAFAEALTGNASNNYLRGNGGADTLNGAGGSDIVDYSTASAAVTVDLQAGTGIAPDGTDLLSAIENAFGSAFNDILRGDAGNNSLRGRLGNDTLDGRAGLDRADYRSAAGAVTVSLVTNTSSGADGSDTLISIEDVRGSEFYGDTLTGNASANAIDGMGGNDLIDGMGGDDTIDGSLGDDIWLYGGAGNDSVLGGDGRDALGGGAGNDTLRGGAGFDYLRGEGGNDLIDGGGDNDEIEFGDIVGYNDYAAPGAVLVDLALGTATIAASGETDTLVGLGGAVGTDAFGDTLRGAAAGEYFGGKGGNDLIQGFGGTDRLQGDQGNDTLDGGAGFDQVGYWDVNGAVVASLVTNTGGGADAGSDVFIAVEGLQGGAFNDSLTGNDAANWLWGQGGNDTLVAGGGNDTIWGGLGNDSIVGGLGIDTADWRYSGAGRGIIATTTSATDGVQTDTLSGIENLIGTELNDRLTGNALANLLSGWTGNDSLAGGAGNDTLDGGLGTDTLVGGDGNDTYIVDVATDRVTELGTVSSTADVVRSSVTWTLGANLERLTLTGGTAINGTGNLGANLLTGNAAANVLSGGGDNDTLNGGAGNDLLIGGSGKDSLSGGAGLDAFRFTGTLAASNVDRVNAFVSADDVMQLDDAAFAGIGATGALAAGAFRLGPAAGDANDRVIYNAATGQLFYDADGSGAGAQVLFATVAAGTTIVAADFVIV